MDLLPLVRQVSVSPSLILTTRQVFFSREQVESAVKISNKLVNSIFRFIICKVFDLSLVILPKKWLKLAKKA